MEKTAIKKTCEAVPLKNASYSTRKEVDSLKWQSTSSKPHRGSMSHRGVKSHAGGYTGERIMIKRPL
jgi:hypothetical protein